jgi:hypothetical protein
MPIMEKYPEKLSGLHFRDVDISTLEQFTHDLETNNEKFERFKSNPTGELEKIGITLNPQSAIGKRLIECVSNSKRIVPDPHPHPRCLIYSSAGHCIVIPVPPPLNRT